MGVNPKSEGKAYYFGLFFQNLYEIKQNWPERGASTPRTANGNDYHPVNTALYDPTHCRGTRLVNSFQQILLTNWTGMVCNGMNV